VKSNWSRRGLVERHVLQEILLESIDSETGKPIVTSRMRFVELAEDVDRDALLTLGRDERPSGRTDQASDWLAHALADGEWHDSAGLKSIAAADGIAERTLKRAAQDLAVQTERRGFPATTCWKIPQSGQPLPPTLGPTGTPTLESHFPAFTPSVGPTVSVRKTGPTGTLVACLLCGETYLEEASGSDEAACPSCRAPVSGDGAR
jgi:hypothetical protein